MIGTYFIKNLLNNKFYVGHSVNINQRFNSHKSALRKNKHHNKHLQRAWNKYGENNFEFEIYKICNTEIESIEIEQYYIDNYKDMLYNISKKAKDGGDLLSYHPNKKLIIEKGLETRKENMSKMSKEELSNTYGRKGEDNGMYGRHHSEKSKNKISQKNTGAYRDIKGKTYYEFFGEEKAVEIKNNLSDKAKLKIGELNSFYGKHHSEESKNKIREKQLGKKPPNMKKVKIEEDEYESLTEASRQLGVTPTTILNRIKSKNFPNYYYI